MSCVGASSHASSGASPYGVRKVCDFPLPIERNDPGARVRKIFRHEPVGWPETIVGERVSDLDLVDSKIEHVSRLGSFDVDRAGQNRAAWPAILYFFIYGAKTLRDLVGWNSKCFKAGGAACRDRFNMNGIARRDAQYGFGGNGVVPPNQLARTGLQLEVSLRYCTGRLL